ncbi:hypothetical protein BRAO375_4180025 [Bradyrhizobium sp. ORS 375]|nr:hypothetical protein BRAO375_4180025 [Bradyrhizobium sp. ORS 375]
MIWHDGRASTNQSVCYGIAKVDNNHLWIGSMCTEKCLNFFLDPVDRLAGLKKLGRADQK